MKKFISVILILLTINSMFSISNNKPTLNENEIRTDGYTQKEYELVKKYNTAIIILDCICLCPVGSVVSIIGHVQTNSEFTAEDIVGIVLGFFEIPFVSCIACIDLD